MRMFLYSDCSLSSNWRVVIAFVTAIITYNTTVTEPYYSIDQYPHQHGGGEVRQPQNLTILSTSTPTNTDDGRYDSHRALLFYRPVPPPTRRRGGTTVTEPYYSIDQYPHQHGGGEVRQPQNLTILSTSTPTNTDDGRYDSHRAAYVRPISCVLSRKTCKKGNKWIKDFAQVELLERLVGGWIRKFGKRKRESKAAIYERAGVDLERIGAGYM